MILLILSLFAQADETEITIDFEDVDITADNQKPDFVFISEQSRPEFRPLAAEFIIDPMFSHITTKKETQKFIKSK